MEYSFQDIERKWKQVWVEKEIYKVSNNSGRPKYYILDMFPYPSGAGLHVGHPLGYIASDIYARYKRLCGYNVLHPMGYDAFGLPAEQYALETGQHPAVTTEENITRYRAQLDNIGFCYDWSREVRTSDPKYYKWTQWIFLQLFHSWYDRVQQKARPVHELIAVFEQEGNRHIPCPEEDQPVFDAAAWQGFSAAEKRAVLMKYRLAYLSYAEVWWCEGLGTVLANDEVVNGVSERGGFPVVKKKMRQWFLRITEYADRLLAALDTLEWSDAMKEMQRNWIGKSNGAQLRFTLAGTQAGEGYIEVFTTRPDTVFGVDFIVLAPEHELVPAITTPEQQEAVAQYQLYVQSRSERERMSEVKQVTGCFTGAYAAHPFTGRQLPVWISEYVLAGYGTGAIMAVPAGDERDHAFAQHFEIPVTNIFGEHYNGEAAYAEKHGTLTNSDFLDGMDIAAAGEAAVKAIESTGIGRRQVNYKLRDAGFSRQRYWGEPFPIIYKEDIPYAIDEPELDIPEALRRLPVELPAADSYRPGPEGQGPLANIREWVETPGGQRETNTMPGYAGSSWYFLRYMDPHNDKEFAGRDATDYWQQVDLYIGGTEHAVGHLLYSRMWTKVLHDLGHLSFDEPFKKLVNQGMIQGSSRLIYFVSLLVEKTKEQGAKYQKVPNFYISKCYFDNYEKEEVRNEIGKYITNRMKELGIDIYAFRMSKNPGEIDIADKANYLRVDVSLVNGAELDYRKLKSVNPNFSNAEFILEDGKYICGTETEKMSKSKYNVVNPDDIVAQYGADTFRIYEMFLGPIDVSKPWDTKGIEGVHRFLKKLWRLYADAEKGWQVTDAEPSEAEWRILHKTIKKTGEDIERLAFNTAVSQFMICVNELTALACHKRAVLEPLTVLIAPFAPHLAEELWHRLGHEDSVLDAAFPAYEEKYVTENTKKYPVAINGKTRTELAFPQDATQQQVEQDVLADPTVQKWLEGKPPKKVIYVKGKMINVVC